MKNEEITEFCIYCGAHIPKREGEGTCPKCDPPKKTCEAAANENS